MATTSRSSVRVSLHGLGNSGSKVGESPRTEEGWGAPSLENFCVKKKPAFKKCLFIFERERSFIHCLTAQMHPTARATRLKSGARSSLGTQAPELALLSPSMCIRRSRIGSGAAGARTSIQMGCWCRRRKLNLR